MIHRVNVTGALLEGYFKPRVTAADNYKSKAYVLHYYTSLTHNRHLRLLESEVKRCQMFKMLLLVNLNHQAI